MKYGYCLNHPNTYAVNAKKLCAVCTKERHERSAESKNMVVKKKSTEKEIEKDNGINTTRRRAIELRSIQESCERNERPHGKVQEKRQATFKKAKINPISKDKATEIATLGAIKKQKIEVQGKVCEMCGKHGEVDLFHIIGVGDKKHSTNTINLILSCRFCHLVWGANDWSKIVKFLNFDEIMERLKSLDEGKYWKLKHKIDEYKNGNRRI